MKEIVPSSFLRARVTGADLRCGRSLPRNDLSGSFVREAGITEQTYYRWRNEYG
jgi:hypothetical protein